MASECDTNSLPILLQLAPVFGCSSSQWVAQRGTKAWPALPSRLSAASRHQLRVSLKKRRYAAEFSRTFMSRAPRPGPFQITWRNRRMRSRRGDDIPFARQSCEGCYSPVLHRAVRVVSRLAGTRPRQGRADAAQGLAPIQAHSPLMGQICTIATFGVAPTRTDMLWGYGFVEEIKWT